MNNEIGSRSSLRDVLVQSMILGLNPITHRLGPLDSEMDKKLELKTRVLQAGALNLDFHQRRQQNQ